MLVEAAQPDPAISQQVHLPQRHVIDARIPKVDLHALTRHTCLILCPLCAAARVLILDMSHHSQ